MGVIAKGILRGCQGLFTPRATRIQPDFIRILRPNKNWQTFFSHHVFGHRRRFFEKKLPRAQTEVHVHLNNAFPGGIRN